jgi:hypothetical protein
LARKKEKKRKEKKIETKSTHEGIETPKSEMIDEAMKA